MTSTPRPCTQIKVEPPRKSISNSAQPEPEPEPEPKDLEITIESHDLASQT
jgi:hypothetical protein